MDSGKSSFTIMGAGRSGIAAARLLKGKGFRVFLSDENPADKLKFLDEGILKREKIDYELGRHSERIFENDVIVKSPGIFADNESIKRAREQGKTIISEVELAFQFCKSPVIAITGTNGKTTTTVLTGEIFRNAGFDVKVCGNVGLAFSEIINELKEDSVVVLEVSSFQLEDTIEFKPAVSMLLNITPDHIDWHKNFENYLRAKLKITNNQDERDLTIVNYDDEILRNGIKHSKAGKAFFSIKEKLLMKGVETGGFIDDGKIIYFSKKKKIEEVIMGVREINIRGNHNLYNSLAAIISAKAFEIRKEIISKTLKNFPGVEHRIEFVREYNGVMFYNDSKATNLDSLVVALESFEGSVVLILGGREKGNNYSKVDELVKKKVKAIIAIGETRDKIFEHFEGVKKVYKADLFEEAVKKSFEISEPGDTVLLSPACKSFDMFDNFEHRGNEFKRLVNKIK